MRSRHPNRAGAGIAGLALGAWLAWIGSATTTAAEQSPPPPTPPREVQRPAPVTPGRPTPGGAAAAAPTVAQIEPNQLTPGQTYPLALTGTNFQATMQVDLGPGIVIQRPLSVANSSHATLRIQVLPGTAAGTRLVNVSFTPPAALSAMPPMKTRGPGYVQIVAPAAATAVALDLLTPREVPQGQQATLTLLGSGFASGMALSFGPGISALGSVQVQSPTKATLNIQVSPQAPTMSRVPTLLMAGKPAHVSPEATLTVTAAAANAGPTPTPVPRPTPQPINATSVPLILAVSPSRLYTGQTYTLTLRGMNLVPQLQIDLGSGIKPVGGLRIQSASLATLDVAVQDGAQTGLHWVGLQLPAALVPVREDANVLVQRSPAAPGHGFAPRPGNCTTPSAPHPGTIVLDGPLYTGVSADYGSTFNVPVLNDQTTLSWHEANAGLADRVEIHFFSGKTLIATRALAAPSGYAIPHSLSADDGLIAELTGKVSGRATKLVNQNLPPGTPLPSVGWDLTWQVVGYKTFYSSCVSPAALLANGGLVGKAALGKGTEVVVEQSEKVPINQPTSGDPLLDLTAAPTGLACGAPPARTPRLRGGNGAGSGSPPPASVTNLLLSNTSRVSLRGGRTATADYVGDKWQFSGQIDLSNAPWAIESQQSVNSENPGFPVETEALNNVFVDWGDGTVEPLTIQWHGQYCGNQTCFASNTETSTATQFDLDSASNPSAFGHAYAEVGQFDVRVYMLPAAAVQQQGALPVSVGAGAGGLYGKLVSRAGASSAAASTGNLAYQLVCQAVNIQHRTDPVSNGPLKLASIQITGFPGDGAAGGLVESATHQGRLNTPTGTAPVKAAARVNTAAPISGVARVNGVARPNGLGVGTAAVPQFSSCDVNLVGGASLGFLGQGTVKLSWYQDGVPVGSSEEPVGPSPSRNDAELTPPNPHAPLPGTWTGLKSPALGLAQQSIGGHQLLVLAEVAADSHPIGHALEKLRSYAAGARPPAAAPSAPSGALAQAPPLGVLGPGGAAKAGMPPIAWVDAAPSGAPGIALHVAGAEHLVTGAGGSAGAPVGNPPNSVVSTPAAYAITAANPSLPCTFNFPVAGGKFVLAGLQNGSKATVQQQNGSYSGTGVLQAEFADASGTSTQQEPVTIHLNGWTMQPDGVTVAKGSFKETLALSPMHAPGVTVTLTQLNGNAGDKVTATLNVAIANTDIAAVGSQPPAPWKNVAATLSPQGDWYADKLNMPALLVYDSGYTLSASSVTLDLSATAGQGADASCQGGSGKAWMGVMLNQPMLTAFNLDLPNPPTAPAPGWALDGYGFCGRTNFPASSAQLDRGSLSWAGIIASASMGAFSASYNGLTVHAPWLNVDLTSPQATTLLTAGRNAGQGGINLNLTSPSKVTLTEGPIVLTASNLSFASLPTAGGWAVKSDATFGFASLKGQFANGIALSGLDFGMNGAASFADGTSSRHLNLAGQKGNIGGSLVDLKTLDVTVGAGSSTNRLSFAFDSTLMLSKTLPSADVAVSYAIAEPSTGNYQGTGPVTSPFKIDKLFPDANPSVHLSMKPTYTGSGGSNNAPGSGVLFSSSLDLGMFGGPPVSGQFVLGYVGADDYWLAKAVLDLGPTGVAIVPPILNLYQVGGGMGYNVTLDSFKNSDLTKATPQDDGTLLFDATLLVGSPDHTTFGLLGDFVIKPGGQDPGGRMDYHAWLLDPNWSGQSPIYGYFSYSGGNFDGTLNANLSLLNDQIALNATHDAIHMHVGGGQWYYHIGTQSNPLDGHLFFATGQAWADLGSDGFGLGLISRLDIDAGDCGGACAYIHDNWTVSAAITPSPLSFSAQAGESFSLGACADGFCVNANASANVTIGLPPPYLNFNFGIGGCPPGQINVGLQVLPSLNPSVGGNVCL